MTTVFNIAKGREAYYASLPAANDALLLVFLETAGLEPDGTLEDYDTLAAVLAGASNEQTTIGRQTLTGVSVTVDDTADETVLAADQVVLAATAGSPVGKALVVYDPDTTGGTDAAIVPISAHDYAFTPDGLDLTVTLAPFLTCE